MHYNHCVNLSVYPSAVSKMLITLESHGIFDQISHMYACQHCLTTDMR